VANWYYQGICSAAELMRWIHCGMVMLGLGPLDVQFQRKRTQHDAGLVLKGIVLGVIDILQAIQQG
ncbi:uncharacterized protein METZ01_LOCUS497381, partial [marine metagenome]